MDQLDFLKWVGEQKEKHVNNFIDSSTSLLNTLLTINGLFLSLFAIFADKFTGPIWIIKLLIILTALPILIILYLFWLNKFGYEKILYMHTRSTNDLLNKIKNPKNDSPQSNDNENSRDKKKLDILAKPTKILIRISMFMTFISVVLIVFLFLYY